jgi:hypothetical protein
MRMRVAGVMSAVAACLAVASVLVASALGAPASGRSAARPASRPDHAGAAVAHHRVRGFDGDNAAGRIVNLTPYAWTLVGSGANDTTVQFWDKSSLPATVQPGQSFTYKLKPQASYATTHVYNGWFSYRADTINHAEYLTVDLEGSHCTGICLPRDGPALVPTVYNATRAPQHNNQYIYDFGPATPNPEIGSTASGYENVWPFINSAFDFTFQTKGTYTLDASKAPPQLTALINAMCAGAAGTSCSFTKIGDIHWSTGELDQQATVKSCGPKPPGVLRTRPPRTPPADSPDWHAVSVEAKRTRSVSVGGSLTGSAALKLFGVIDSEVSARVGIEHEWSDTKTFEKTTRIYIPQDWVAGVWSAPVVGKVTGTLVVKTAVASYTITNFEETASGVSRDLTTPAFDILTSSHEMSAKQYRALCAGASGDVPPPNGGRG